MSATCSGAAKNNSLPCNIWLPTGVRRWAVARVPRRSSGRLRQEIKRSRFPFSRLISMNGSRAGSIGFWGAYAIASAIAGAAAAWAIVASGIAGGITGPALVGALSQCAFFAVHNRTTRPHLAAMIPTMIMLTSFVVAKRFDITEPSTAAFVLVAFFVCAIISLAGSFVASWTVGINRQ